MATRAQQIAAEMMSVIGIHVECGYMQKVERYLAERVGEVMAEQRAAAVAYVRDRAEQYVRASGVRAGLEDVAVGLNEGEHTEAAAHGELDDLIADSDPAKMRDRVLISIIAAAYEARRKPEPREDDEVFWQEWMEIAKPWWRKASP